jgi:hypothetical protein
MSIEAMWRALKVLENKKLRMDEHLIPIVVDDLRQAIEQAKKQDEPPDYVEPVTTDYHEGWEEGFKAGNALAPPKPWVGLTDEEMTKIASKTLTFKQFVEIIEAKLKERNT